MASVIYRSAIARFIALYGVAKLFRSCFEVTLALWNMPEHGVVIPSAMGFYQYLCSFAS